MIQKPGREAIEHYGVSLVYVVPNPDEVGGLEDRT